MDQPQVSYKPDSNHIEIKENNESNDRKIEKNSNLDYDNKAFELEDIPMDLKNPFNRQERPGSMMSIRSNASTTSRSSVNCTSGRIRCPNLRLRKFFSYKADSGFQKASNDIKPLILPGKDGNYIGSWLLIEISNWDLHREKVIMLSEKTLFIISYDFIKSRINDYQRISLSDIKKIKFGNLKYPKNSFMGDYAYGAVKISWTNEENLSFMQKWNPLSQVPFILLTSHHILYSEKEKETDFYNCDEFIASLEYAISKLIDGSNVEIKEEPIEIESYASLISVLYNHNWLGFQLDRNGINY